MTELAQAQADFAAHMAICGACDQLQPCWQVDELCKRLVAAGIFG